MSAGFTLKFGRGLVEVGERELLHTNEVKLTRVDGLFVSMRIECTGLTSWLGCGCHLWTTYNVGFEDGTSMECGGWCDAIDFQATSWQSLNHFDCKH